MSKKYLVTLALMVEIDGDEESKDIKDIVETLKSALNLDAHEILEPDDRIHGYSQIAVHSLKVRVGDARVCTTVTLVLD